MGKNKIVLPVLGLEVEVDPVDLNDPNFKELLETQAIHSLISKAIELDSPLFDVFKKPLEERLEEELNNKINCRLGGNCNGNK